jgi:transposase InsO family protein
MDDTMPTALVADALKMAVELRGGDVRGVIFHSDRGAISVGQVQRAV